MAIPFPPETSRVVSEEPRLALHFTGREKDVGGWLAEGKTDPEIARILNLGLETVRSYVKSLREKTGVENRNALLAWIWRDRRAAELSQPPVSKPAKYT